MKFKNPPDAPESILLRGLQKKFEPIRPRGLGCRGGAIDFGPTTSYNSGTSVVMIRKTRQTMHDMIFIVTALDPQIPYCRVPSIGVGRGPSGPSIEGPFCCVVHLCLELRDRRIEKKAKKERK